MISLFTVRFFIFQSEVVYVLKRITIGPDEICSFVIGDACGDVYNPYHEWEVAFPPVPKPALRELDAPVDKAPTFKVLQISDTHFDPYYAEGEHFYILAHKTDHLVKNSRKHELI